jgi:hypothetical protein
MLDESHRQYQFWQSPSGQWPDADGEGDNEPDSNIITLRRVEQASLAIRASSCGACEGMASRHHVFAPALLLGDHSVSDPPDPISNSAVKPDCANGTNAQALEE